MKGVIIYSNPMWGDNERATFCEFINEASFDVTQYAPKTIISSLKGETSKLSKTVCSEDDTYDFETGALIALMKMCGLEKSAKAYAEIFDDTAYGDALKERDRLERLLREAKEVINTKARFINEKNEEIEKLKKEKEQIIVAKSILNNKLIEENSNLSYIKSCNESTIESLEKTRDLLINKNNELIEENEKLKLDCEKLQHGYIDTDMIFCWGRACGKQYKTLVELFKKIPKEKVEAAYKEAYNTELPAWKKEFLNQIYGIYKVPTKREKMWDDIKTFTWKGASCIEVNKADVIDFLEELEKEIPLVHWPTGDKPTSFQPMFIYKTWHECDKVYFFIDDDYVTYGFDKESSRTNVQYVTYLPPMRWDLFKKGRKIIRVTPDNFSEAMARIRANVNLATAYKGWESVIKNNFNKSHAFIRISTILKGTDRGIIEFMWPEDLVKKQLADPTVYSSNKIVYWEDIR